MLPYYSFPHEAAIHVNGSVLLFSAAVALLTGILFGISPAWQFFSAATWAVDSVQQLKDDRERSRTQSAPVLIAGQVALTLLLMAGAGSAMKSFMALTIRRWIRSGPRSRSGRGAA
jgi:hypothetical protein